MEETTLDRKEEETTLDRKEEETTLGRKNTEKIKIYFVTEQLNRIEESN